MKLPLGRVKHNMPPWLVSTLKLFLLNDEIMFSSQISLFEVTDKLLSILEPI